MAKYQFQGQDIVAPFRITSNEPVFASDSVSLKQRRVAQGAQRWELEFGVLMQDPSSAFADMVSTFNDNVTMTMPQLNVRGETISSGTATSAVTVASNASSGDTQISPAGANGTINKSRFIKFSNHDKIYLVTQNYSGSGFLSIYPSLRVAVPASTAILYKDSDAINLTAIRDLTNLSGIQYTDGILSDVGNINLIEVL